MQTVQISEFKAKCLSLVDEVASSGEVLVVTKNGKPVAEVRPFSGGRFNLATAIHHRAILVTADAHIFG